MAKKNYNYDAPVAYGYCRKSTTEQREESIEAQQRAIVAYAAACGYNLVKIYKDHGNSGRNGERPQFAQMVQDASAGGAQFIIVHKLDRFFRNAERQTLVEAQLRRHGVRVLSASEHFDDSPQGQFMRNITKAINQWYSANLAQEVMKGLRENAIACRNTGGPPPLGYAVDKATGKFVLEPKEAEAVRIIFRMYLQDAGYTAIIEELNRGGYLTRRGRPFGKNSIYEILRNEKYAGVYVWNRLAPADPDGHVSRRRLKPRSEWVYVENGMPRIIEPEDFRRAQKEMEKRRHKSGRQRAKVFYLLSGLVYCGGCGGPMSGEVRRYKSHHKDPVEYRYYACTTKKRMHSAGDHVRSIPADKLESAVLQYLQNIVLHPDTMEALCTAVLASMQQEDSPADKAASRRKQAAALEPKINRLYTAIENGLDGPDTIQRIKELQAQRGALLEEAEALEREAGVTTATVEKLCHAWAGIRLDHLPSEQLRMLIRELVEKIIVYDDGTDAHRVRIVLNPAKRDPEELPPDLAVASLGDLGTPVGGCVGSLPLPEVPSDGLLPGPVVFLFVLWDSRMVRLSPFCWQNGICKKAPPPTMAGKGRQEIALQNLLHPDLLGLQAASLVESHGLVVAVPDVQGHVVAVVGTGVVQHRLVEGFAHMLAAAGLVHAEIVDVQAAHRGEDVVIGMLLEDAEGIAQQAVVLVGGGQDGALVVVQNLQQLLIGVFAAAALEEVGPGLMVDQLHLHQQLVDAGQILFHCHTNFHWLRFLSSILDSCCSRLLYHNPNHSKSPRRGSLRAIRRGLKKGETVT